MRKLRVAVVFGGKTAEHEVSIRSARNVIEALDKQKYEIVPIFVNREGRWLTELNQSLSVTVGYGERFLESSQNNIVGQLDVVFPVMHGPLGEDGTVQGLLKLASVPFVGAGVMGSAIGMDKDVAKRLLRDARIPIAKFMVFDQSDKPSFAKISKSLKLPFFIKPANLGSSVGVSKVRNKNEFNEAIRSAFLFDNKILAEEYIAGREIECSVLGNDHPIASVPGEIIVHDDFYSYDAKYVNEAATDLQIPADLPKNIILKIQKLAVTTFKVLCCEGMARVDFFLRNNGQLFVNEINTIPGFTNISMYPKLWEASGISYSELLDRLIELAIQRYKADQKILNSI